MSSSPDKVILYDGVCGLCHRFVIFSYRRDPEGHFHFAPLQGRFAAEVSARQGCDLSQLTTLVVVVDWGQKSERLLDRSQAVLYVLRRLETRWRHLARLSFLPRCVLDFGYAVVARSRYRLFRPQLSCALPTPEFRARLLD